MGRQPPGLNGGPGAPGAVDFALIGHQENWPTVFRLVHALREPTRPRLSDDTVREVVPWIPARTIARLSASSLERPNDVSGVYIESFITPDDLNLRSPRQCVEKVRAAIRAAGLEGARVASLGGFTSIVLEGRAPMVEECQGLALTTGNTLTAAFIVSGVEAAAGLLGTALSEATLLLVGATGDVGSACARWFSGRVRRLVIAARSSERLARLQAELRPGGSEVIASTDASALLGQADVVICTASLACPGFDVMACRPDAIICDAGYPKNLRAAPGLRPRLFWGGIGVIQRGWRSEGGRLEAFYEFPVSGAGHGCMLEGVLLAMEGRFESFSQGRGNIGNEQIQEIWEMGLRHGIVTAPFFNHDGLWREQPV